MSSPVRGQEAPLFRVPVRVVIVPAVAVDPAGGFVRNLSADDFTLLDNDRPQHIQLDYAEAPLSVAIAIESSYAVRAWLPSVRRIAGMVEDLILGQGGDAAVVTFNDKVRVVQSFTADTALIDKAFRSLAAAGDRSRCLDALVESAALFGQVLPERRRVLLLISRAGDSGSSARLKDVLGKLESADITVYSLVMPRVGKDLIEQTVSIRGLAQSAKASTGRDAGFIATVDLGKLLPELFQSAKATAGEDPLTIASSYTGGHMIPFRKLHDLEAGVSAIAEEIHTGYVLSYQPDLAGAGYHRIVVTARQPNLTVRARPGYYIAR